MLDWTGLCYGVEALGSDFNSSPAEDKMGLSHGKTEGNRTLQGNSLNITSSIKLSTILHPPVRASGNSCSCGTPKAPLLAVTGGHAEGIPLEALGENLLEGSFGLLAESVPCHCKTEGSPCPCCQPVVVLSF